MLELYVQYGNVLMLRVLLCLGVFLGWRRIGMVVWVASVIGLCRFVGVLWIESGELLDLDRWILTMRGVGKSCCWKGKVC